jgi:DNA-binding transcriptional LysR family regulator
MAPRDLGWEFYRSLLAVLRQGSLSAAARALGLTQPTIGRHIAELERALGVALFTRSPRGLLPTEAARELEPHAQAMAHAADALVRAASGEAGAARGTVRITASEIIGAEVLPKILASFRERHPAVTIELVLSNRPEDLLRREVDIAVRMLRPTQSALVARRIGRVALGLFAHRCYLQVRGIPRDLDAVRVHSLIGFDRDPYAARLLGQHGIALTPDLFTLRTDNDLAQLAAIRAGFGIGVCQVGIGRREPDFVQVVPDGFGFELEVWVAMHEDLRAARRMRLMFAHVAAGLSVYVASSQRSHART